MVREIVSAMSTRSWRSRSGGRMDAVVEVLLGSTLLASLVSASSSSSRTLIRNPMKAETRS